MDFTHTAEQFKAFLFVSDEVITLSFTMFYVQMLIIENIIYVETFEKQTTKGTI